jgi:hypothetical protein
MGAPRSDYVHFTGVRKPWFHGPPANVTEENRLDSDAHFWFYHLEQLNDELDMGLNFTGWTIGRSRRPLLGMYPLYGAVLTSNTTFVGTEQVEDGNDNDNDDQTISNTNLVGTEQVEGGDDNDNGDQSMNATRLNLTGSHVSVSHHAYGLLLTNATDTGTVVTERMSDHATAVVTQNLASSYNSGTANHLHTTRRHHRHQHLRNSTAAAVLNDRTISSEQEISFA